MIDVGCMSEYVFLALVSKARCRTSVNVGHSNAGVSLSFLPVSGKCLGKL